MNVPFPRADANGYVRSETCGCSQETPLLLSPMLSLKFIPGGCLPPFLSRNWVPHDFSGPLIGNRTFHSQCKSQTQSQFINQKSLISCHNQNCELDLK